MLLSPEMMLPMGPPPQAVLDQRWLWQILLTMLGATAVLRLLGVDVAGAMLTGLMLFFSVIITRDGMQEVGKYALIFAVLCGLNFFFDALPLLTEVGGRMSRSTQPIEAHTTADGVRSTTYTVTTKVTPFFDPSQGIIYNAQSAAMLASPLCMALGVYLALSAHNEIQRMSPEAWATDIEDFAFAPPTGISSPSLGALASSASARGRGQTAMDPRETFERFSGTGHKLDG